jgi:DNA-binding CsgD family transcriptional regulator
MIKRNLLFFEIKQLRYFIFFILLPTQFIGCDNNNISEGGKSSAKVKQEELKQMELDSLFDLIETRLQSGKREGYKDELLMIAKEAENIGYFEKQLILYSSLGNYYYGQSYYDSAGYYWDYACQLMAELKKEPQPILATLKSNLGALYLSKGFKTLAIEHFLQAKEILEKFGLEDENYYKIILNIAVSHMSLNQFEEANEILRDFPVYTSKEISFLYFMNKYKIAHNLNNPKEIRHYGDSAIYYLQYATLYKEIFEELQLEILLASSNTKHQIKVLNNLLDSYDEKYIYVKILINKLHLNLYKKPFVTEQSLLEMKQEVITEKDFYLYIQYYDLMTDYFSVQKKFDLANANLIIKSLYNDSLNSESKTNSLQEYKLQEERLRRDLKVKNLETINKLQGEKLIRKTWTIWIFALFAILACVIVALLFAIYKRNKFNFVLKTEILEKSLQISKLNELSLKQNLETNEGRLQELFRVLSKFAILRKQMEAFFDNQLEQNIADEQLNRKFKSAKSDFQSFFVNYQELAILASVPEYTRTKVQKAAIIYKNLNQNDVQVLSLIMQNYTNNEMSQLMNVTVKNIEYYRSKIRKKLQIPSDLSIQQFINEHIDF